MRIICPVVLLAGALALPDPVACQATDPWFGTWKLNVARSKYRAGQTPRDTVTKIEPWERGLKYTVDTVNALGEARHIEWSAKFDGRDHPVQGDPDVDTAAIKRVGARAYEVVLKKGGKITTTTRNVISRDGRTRTATAIQKNAQLTEGRNITDVAVFDKQ